MSTDQDLPRYLKLDDVETTWRRQRDPLRFALIYGPAIRRLLLVLLGREDAADDALQDVLLKMTEGGLAGYDPARGHFRPYLKAIVRNVARTKSRKTRAAQPADAEVLDSLTRPEPDEAERAWLEEWRGCLLGQALRALERHQREAGRGNLAYTVIRLSIENQGAGSRELAARASELTGQLLTPETFRKQISRARRTFAELLVGEVRKTLDRATAEEVADELAALGLFGYVRDYLPGGE